MSHAEVLTSADGTPLKISLARSMRRQKWTAFALVAPLLVFLLLLFAAPIGQMLYRGISNGEFAQTLPETAARLEHWDRQALPDEETFAVFAAEVRAAAVNRSLGQVAKRLNYQQSGMRSLLSKTARKLKRIEQGPYKEALGKIDPRWTDLTTWKNMAVVSGPVTSAYFLTAIDMELTPDGEIQRRPEERRIYLTIFARTLGISTFVTVMCILLAYPIAYRMATLPAGAANLLMILVLLPFWTSLLVRTTAWIVLLQREGVLNDILIWLGVLNERIQLIYNMTGTITVMTYIMLPFMVLPLYSVMKTIPPAYMQAALSLGANPVRAFGRVYLPQTLSGLGAGSILVFILCIGYYITPALVGGSTGTMISNFIANHMQQTLNWGLAAALGSLLLGAVLALYWVYNRLMGANGVNLG